MRMYDIILKKRNGEVLSKQEIEFVVNGYVNGEIPDYQVSALLMAIYFKKMNEEETLNLTMAMAHSGEMLDLSGISGKKIDKHSTGGVGDKTTLIVAPIAASLGVKVAKMSGRGLGHTGGTIDKLESIEGFKTVMSDEEFIRHVNDINIALVSQTKNLAPADKLLYALRDVTATVDNLSLIASSIMSKKLASGADGIVLDVKTGNGALMTDEQDSKKKKKTMVKIGEGAGRNVVALVTDMDEPLGFAVGNALEVEEAIETLKGRGPQDLTNLCVYLAAYMVMLNDGNLSFDKAVKMAKDALYTGRALAKFREFIIAQGGDDNIINDTSLIKKGRIECDVKSEHVGYIKRIDTRKIGSTLMTLGGGREKKEDGIDYGVGIIVQRKIGDYVNKGDIIARIYGNNEASIAAAKKNIIESIEFSDSEVSKKQLIKYIITKDKIIKKLN